MDTTIEQQAQWIIDKMWNSLSDERFQGRSPYDVARMFGANDKLAQKVDELWNGPRPLR